ncbi:MAG: (deoxy)nucleoside triphosphate pyrophosphohydrolase [Acidobacteria bacterium]|nr:(deoxy)nucleoside triphosphate pyrophosphohydrolase [Acidobacteriota bacterium]
MTTTIIVTAAVIERDGRFFMTRRLKGTHLAGMWEFPGGKCGPDESLVASLERELMEELGSRSVVGKEIFTVEHAYPERTVRLHFYATTLLDEPQPILGQEMRWVSRAELRDLQLPEADRGLVDLLTAPK